ncbi:MAG: LysR family transcriptional regulator [Polyangiaceae bacterium]
MADTLELEVFHCVVRFGSYAKAADALSLSPSGVSRIVTRLEERLGTRLLQRTTRKLSLTEAGTAFHARTAQVLLDLADAEAEAREATLRPRGTLRVSASVVFGHLHAASIFAALLEQYPELSLEVSLSDRFVDLIGEGLDLAIRIGALSDSQLVARRLCTNHRVLVAAPSYLKRRGTPSTASDLTQHDCLLFTGFTRPREWRLTGPDGPTSVQVSGPVASSNPVVLNEMAKRGLGIAVGATLAVAPALLAGDLVRVMPQYEFEASAIFAVFPSARQLSTKVRAAVDFLAQHLGDPPSWDRALRGRVAGF